MEMYELTRGSFIVIIKNLNNKVQWEADASVSEETVGGRTRRDKALARK